MVAPRTEVLVTFDFEGRWGMPFDAPYDLPASVGRILARLEAHAVSAVFFTVGEIARAHPDVIATIARAGHEIGLHGHRHERFGHMDDATLIETDVAMSEDEVLIAEITGRRPTAFRAPHLLAPRHRDRRLEQRLAARGYTWVSNCETRHAVELLRPGLIRSRRPADVARSRPRMLDGAPGRTVGAVLNLGMLATHRPPGSPAATLRWMADGYAPFQDGDLLEVPVTGPLDCDVIGLPRPEEPSSAADLAYAEFAMQRSLHGRGGLAMLTYHDWIVGSANRIALLDSCLGALRRRGLTALQSDGLLARHRPRVPAAA